MSTAVAFPCSRFADEGLSCAFLRFCSVNFHDIRPRIFLLSFHHALIHAFEASPPPVFAVHVLFPTAGCISVFFSSCYFVLPWGPLCFRQDRGGHGAIPRPHDQHRRRWRRIPRMTEYNTRQVLEGLGFVFWPCFTGEGGCFRLHWRRTPAQLFVQVECLVGRFELLYKSPTRPEFVHSALSANIERQRGRGRAQKFFCFWKH